MREIEGGTEVEDPRPYKRAAEVSGPMHLAKKVETEKWRPGRASDRFNRTTWCGISQTSYSSSPVRNSRFKATYNLGLVDCGECLVAYETGEGDGGSDEG